MTMKIGSHLAALRKEQNLTQEQLADMLGISAPAISKWENDSSFPDITLLCPLARALHTNVDSLLQFEENLSGTQVAELANEIITNARTHGYEQAEVRIQDLLHRYPNSVDLRFNMALVWNTFLVFFPAADKETHNRWTSQKKKLLWEVHDSGSVQYAQLATLQLAEMALCENQTDHAEALLKELPEHMVDPTTAWVQLHLKKDAPEEALKLLQRRLFALVRQVQQCLVSMMEPGILPDEERILEVCRVHQLMDITYGCGGLSDGLFLEIYLRDGQIDKATDTFVRYVDAMLGEVRLPNALLFSPTLNTVQPGAIPSMEFRRMLLRGLEAELQGAKKEIYEQLLQNPRCREALERLKASVVN